MRLTPFRAWVVLGVALLEVFGSSQGLAAQEDAKEAATPTEEDASPAKEEPPPPDPLLLEIDEVLKETLPNIHEEWRKTLFIQPNLERIKQIAREGISGQKALLSQETRRAVIRKTLHDLLYGSMRQVVLGEVEPLLLGQIEKLASDWRDLLLAEESFEVVRAGVAQTLRAELVNLPAKERHEKLLELARAEIETWQQRTVAAEVQITFQSAIEGWPEQMKTLAEPRLHSLLRALVSQVLNQTNPSLSRSKVREAILSSAGKASWELARLVLRDEVTRVFGEETSQLGPGLTEAVVIDETTFSQLIAEVENSVGSAVQAADPVSMFQAALPKIRPLVQQALIKERDKHREACLKKEVSVEEVLDPEKYWLVSPIQNPVPKEQETYPYIDERYYTCKATETADLSYCTKFMRPGREEHDVQCKVFALLFSRVLPAFLEAGSYREEEAKLVNEILPAGDPGRPLLEALLRALGNKDAEACKPIKSQNDLFYRICLGGINRDDKACKGTDYPLSCDQGRIAFEAVLYGDESKLTSLRLEDLVSPLPLLALLHFDRSSCERFFAEELKKRYCYNLYDYKPKKEERDERGKR